MVNLKKTRQLMEVKIVALVLLIACVEAYSRTNPSTRRHYPLESKFVFI